MKVLYTNILHKMQEYSRSNGLRILFSSSPLGALVITSVNLWTKLADFLSYI